MNKCTVPGCLNERKGDDLMCGDCWRVLPQSGRDEIQDSYHDGHAGTDAHWTLCLRATRIVYQASQCSDLLSLADVVVPYDRCALWTVEQREQANDWAGAIVASVADNDGITVPPRPTFLPPPAAGTEVTA